MGSEAALVDETMRGRCYNKFVVKDGYVEVDDGKLQLLASDCELSYRPWTQVQAASAYKEIPKTIRERFGRHVWQLSRAELSRSAAGDGARLKYRLEMSEMDTLLFDGAIFCLLALLN